jgi:hypothetical protein
LDGSDYVRWEADAHEVTRTVGGHLRDYGFKDAQTIFLRFSDGQAADREAGKI